MNLDKLKLKRVLLWLNLIIHLNFSFYTKYQKCHNIKYNKKEG
jgi:hypothetical protein